MKIEPRKIGTWFWDNKERLVLVLMIGVLCYRVWQVVNPQPPAESTVYAPPSNVISQGIRPPEPGSLPPVELQPSAVEIVRQNPFRYQASGSRGPGTTGEDTADFGLTLKKIQPVRGTEYVAVVQTKTAKLQYIREGASFEEFKCIAIDSVNKTATFHSSKTNTTVTLTATQ